jgi:hypothetical protein
MLKQHTLPGEPKGEWVPDSDEEPEGFLGTSLVFWDMKRVEFLPRKNTSFSTARLRQETELKAHSARRELRYESCKQPGIQEMRAAGTTVSNVKI